MRILCLCGGGLRGCLQAYLLAKLEDQTGKSAVESFDWIAGTSTGAILTALILARVPMARAIAFYEGPIAEKIFSPHGWTAIPTRIAEGYMYDPQVLHDALIEALGPTAANWSLNQCPANMLITSVRVDGHVMFMCRDNPRNSQFTGRVNLVDAVVASAVAPTFHAPWKIGSDWYFDGGCACQGNPAHMACIEAFEYTEIPPAPAETRAVCLGTGYFPGSRKPPSGLLATVGWAMNELVDSGENISDQNARREYFRTCPQNYRKLNAQLPADIAEDDLGARPVLSKLGQDWAKSIDWKDLLA